MKMEYTYMVTIITNIKIFERFTYKFQMNETISCNQLLINTSKLLKREKLKNIINNNTWTLISTSEHVSQSHTLV